MRWYKSHRWIQRIWLLVVSIFIFVPILGVFIKSLEGTTAYRADSLGAWICRYISLEQYLQIFLHGIEYWAAYWNTLFITIPVLLLSICTTAMCAYGLTILSEKIQKKWLVLYAILALIPMQVLLVPQWLILSKLHLIGMRLAVILVSYCSPWYVFFLYRLCKDIPKETLEMARAEGAGEWTVFTKIALPQMRYGLLVFIIVISADLWGMVEEPVVYIQNISKYPLSVLFHEMEEEISYAGVVLFSLPIVILFTEGIRSVVRKNGEIR